MADDVAIRMEHGWKRYGTTLTAEFRHLWHKPNTVSEERGPWAFRDLNFEVHRGETLGVLGRNGAGKSTLLKVLAGVSPLTKGNFEVNGRIFPMIELNAGMHMDLTGRQNVHLLGAVMGFSPQEVLDRLPEIEDFCELGTYFDQPVWTYSSGMLTRLGFAVAVNVKADILLIDEVLSVGDLGFQKKCFDRLESIRKSGVTIVLVSHSVHQIQRICNEAIWLLDGAITERGEPQIVTRSYTDWMMSERHGETQKINQGVWETSGEITILSVKTFHQRNQETEKFVTFDLLKIQMEYEVYQPLSDLILGLNIYTADMILVHSLVVSDLLLSLNCGTITCTIPQLYLLPGTYILSIRIKDKNNRALLRGERIGQFLVRPMAETQLAVGLVYTPTNWEVNE